MFKSIRLKIIIVYFLLIFVAMIIVGVFIVNQFRNQQIDQISDTMEQQVENLIKYSPTIQKDNWEKVKGPIQEIISRWPLAITDKIYIIANSDMPKVIATAPNSNNKIIGRIAFEYRELDPKLVLAALNREKSNVVHRDTQNNTTIKHLAYPVTDKIGNVKGIIYMTSDLQNINRTISESKIILLKATLLALLVTIVLGFFIAKNITEPINDVTVKAEKMSKGDFNQYVDVKSNDEIGQLANMFNLLTKKLDMTISEIAREKSKMETIFKYMADGLIAVNINGEILHANPIAKNILNIDEKDFSDINFDSIFTKLNTRMSLEHIKNKEDWKGSNIIKFHSSTYRAKYAPFKNEKQKNGGLIVVLQDITEQHKLDNMRREFVANVSHELKTPITTIKSYTETLLEGSINDIELSSQFLSVINSECDRMARIVRDLLKLSNFDYKQAEWEFRSLSVKKLIKDSVMKMIISAEDKHLSLDYSIEEDIENIFADKDGIEQVMLNILSNAIKYTPDKGKVNIDARNDGDNVIIKIEDNGIGIPQNDLKRIFERFYRVDKARSRALGGTGLGLSIAKQIIKAHRGDILIDSEYNKGTVVRIILPKDRKELRNKLIEKSV